MAHPDHPLRYDTKTYRHMVEPAVIRVKIISGRHLVKMARGIASPFVEVEVVGTDPQK